MKLAKEHLQHYITISPGELTISHGMTIAVNDRTLQIREGSSQGLYHNDTRFVSHYRYRFNQHLPTLLTAGYVDYYSGLAHYTNPAMRLLRSELPANQLRLRVARQLDDGRMLEDLRLTNYSMQSIDFKLVVEIKSDFADLFEVRGLHLPFRGEVETVWDPDGMVLVNSYRNASFFAQMRYHIATRDSAPTYANGELLFPILVGPGESWQAAVTITMTTDSPGHDVPRAPLPLRSRQLRSDQLYERWGRVTSRVSAGSELVQYALESAGTDLAAVRLYLPGLPEDVWLPAAGVPWYVTIFGRDSEIASLQTLMYCPGFARATLQVLAGLQGKRVDERRLEEPGKIAHEIRFGQLAKLGEIPHTPYYGTVDATPLFIVLLSEVWRWTGDRALIQRYLLNARAAMQWIDTYGDHDSDGFYDYWRHVPNGLKNQGWKDADNAIVHADGSQVPNPIAMVEFQGYVYDAKLRLADLEEVFGDAGRAQQLRAQAADLQERFHEAFWLERERYFAFGLAAERKPIRTIASNPGHCLWSGIVKPEFAGAVVERLMEDDMFSGWGVRTLSALNPAFNPLDYQLGAIWPHDNAIIALGCKRYGYADATNRIARALFDTAGYFQGYRLPELFGGFQRGAHSLPVLYPHANIPQAWAAGSVFQLMQALLGLEADAPNGVLRLQPTLPQWLPSIAIENMEIGGSRLDLYVSGADAPQIHAKLRSGPGIRVLHDNHEVSLER